MNRCNLLVRAALTGAVLIMLHTPATCQSAKQSKRTSVKNAVLLATLREHKAAPAVRPVVGSYQKVKVEAARDLFDIAREYNVSVTALRRVNKLSGTRIKAGKSLLLPTLHILPRTTTDGIVLNVPERALYVFHGGQMQARYPVAVGKSAWQTALGQFSIRKKLKNPPWKPTKEMVEREGISDEIVPPGPKNPLGDRWIGWTEPGFGFHGTIAPRSIGTAASHGCVRLYPEAVHKLFDEVAVGTPIYSVYEPVLLGSMDGKLYLSIFPDIYHTGLTSLESVNVALESAGLAGLVDPGELKRIVAASDGYPHRILGSDIPFTINGATLHAAIKPTRVREQWIVPLREVAQALGGQVAVQNGAITVSGGGRVLTLRAGEESADLGGNPIALDVRPTVVQGVTMAPLGALTEALGAKVAFEKGKGVDITSVASGTGTSTGQQAPPPFVPPATLRKL